MHRFLISLFSLTFFTISANAERITIVDSNPADFDRQLSPLGQTLELRDEQDSFYEMAAGLPFTQSSPLSFIQQDDSMRFLGQSAGQMLVVEDGIPQRSATGIGGGRSFHFLDPFFYDEVSLHIGGGTSHYGQGAFSGVMHLKSTFIPKEKFLLSTGSYGHQKIGHKKVIKNQYGFWSFEGLRHVKSGPSLERPLSEKEAEDDGRDLHVIRLKWKKKKSDLGTSVQFNFFQDEQDFDQYMADDERPFSKESNVEIITRNVSVVHQDKIWTNILRFQLNEREVKNVLDEQENLLVYENKSVFLSSSIKAVDLMNVDLLEIGIDSSTDLSIEMSEGVERAPHQFFAGGVFIKGTRALGEKHSQLNMSARIDGVSTRTGASAQMGGATKIDDIEVYAQISRNIRLPSFYELYSIYGDDQLGSEKNTAVEVSIKKKFSSSSIRLMTYFQDQKDLIFYDSQVSRYKNIVDNSYYGLGIDGEISEGRLKLDYGAHYNASKKNEFLLGVSPVKFRLNLGYQFSNKMAVRIEEIYFGKRDQFNGEKDAALWSSVNLRYQIYPAIFATLKGQVESPFISNNNNQREGSKMLQISLQGVL